VNELLVAANDEEMDVILTGARLRPTVVDLTTRVGTDLPRSRQGGVAGGSA
jgi:hypothetical protein